MNKQSLMLALVSAATLVAPATFAPGRLTAPVAVAAVTDTPAEIAERRALFRRGAQLWPVYCNTCHNARPGAEFAPSEWNIIIMHMRTQANLPAEDARAVLEFLKASK